MPIRHYVRLAPRERQRRWAFAAGFVVAGWFAGLAIWGRPMSGFGNISEAWAPMEVLIPTVPAMVVAGFLLGSQGRWRVVGMASLVVATCGGAYVEMFSHFGGICLDPDDVRNITWPSRVAALACGLIAVGAGFATERAPAYRHVRHHGRPD